MSNISSGSDPKESEKAGNAEGPSQWDGSVSNRNHCLFPKSSTLIKDVWEENFEEEMWKIMELVEKYNVIGMDTEFPGIVYRPEENDIAYSDLNMMNYKTIKLNVDVLKIIQVGISLADENGYIPEGVSTWQFNFRFDVNVDTIMPDSVDMLVSAGIKFEEHARRGIDPRIFAEYLIGSGLILNEDVKWVCFHGGFDFGYLIKMLIGEVLPQDENEFHKILVIYFPCFYDVKSMIKDIDSLKNTGLNKLATELQIKRVGLAHQGGSDSLLTISAYFKLKELYLKSNSEVKFLNELHGLKSRPEDYLNPNQYYNYLMSDYPFMMMNNMVPLMNSFFPRSDSPFNQGYAGSAGGFNMPQNYMYSNFQPNSYPNDAGGRPRRKE